MTSGVTTCKSPTNKRTNVRMTEHPQEHRQPSRVMEHPQEHSPAGRQAWAADPASPAVPSPQDQALIPLGTEWANASLPLLLPPQVLV